MGHRVRQEWGVRLWTGTCILWGGSLAFRRSCHGAHNVWVYQAASKPYSNGASVNMAPKLRRSLNVDYWKSMYASVFVFRLLFSFCIFDLSSHFEFQLRTLRDTDTLLPFWVSSLGNIHFCSKRGLQFWIKVTWDSCDILATILQIFVDLRWSFVDLIIWELSSFGTGHSPIAMTVLDILILILIIWELWEELGSVGVNVRSKFDAISTTFPKCLPGG